MKNKLKIVAIVGVAIIAAIVYKSAWDKKQKDKPKEGAKTRASDQNRWN